MLTEPHLRLLAPRPDPPIVTLPGAEQRPRSAPSRHRVAAWLYRHRLSIGLLTVVLVALGLLHATGMNRWPVARDDEGTYVTQAWALQRFNTLSHYTYTYDHPPGGWLLLSFWLWVTNGLARNSHAIAAGREFILINQLASSALLYVLCRRLQMRRAFAVAGVVLFSVSPLALDFHRAVYLDNLLTPWLLAAFVFALSPRRHLAAVAGSALCFAAAVLIKETTLLLLPALVYQLWQQADPRTRRMTLALSGTIIFSALASYPLYALLKGELFPSSGRVSLLGGAWWQLFGRDSSGSVFDPGSTANELARLWLEYDTWLPLVGALVLPIGLALRRLRPMAVALALLGLTVLRPGYLPIPYIIGPLVFIPILVAGVADRAWTTAARGRGVTQMGAALCIAALSFFVVQVAPVWAEADQRELRDDPAQDFRSAERWVLRHAPRDSRIVLDNTFWLDLVRSGFHHENMIWHDKLDVDPDVTRRLVRGWRSVDYLISTPGIRGEMRARSMPTLAALHRNSRVVKSFGLGGNVTEIRQILP